VKTQNKHGAILRQARINLNHLCEPIVETRNGSREVVQRMHFGTRYDLPLTRRSRPRRRAALRHRRDASNGGSRVDELVMIQTESKGRLFVHQDRSYNVVALSDMGGEVLERYVYDPHGHFTVQQFSDYGRGSANPSVDPGDRQSVVPNRKSTIVNPPSPRPTVPSSLVVPLDFPRLLG